MGTEWTRWCRSREFVVEPPYVDVRFGDDRRHRVRVEERDDAYELSAVVVRAAAAASVRDLPVRAWLRNRTRSLVGFRVDRRGRLVGEAWVPKVGLTADEFRLHVRTVAAECDRFEYVLTGRDVE